MAEKSLVKDSRSPLLINHLVAVTLQFLGQYDPPYMEEIQLGEFMAAFKVSPISSNNEI